MKKICLIPLCMCLLLNSNIFADGKTRGEFPLQVQLLSGNVGAGPSIGYNLNDTIYVGEDILSRSDTASESTAAATGTFSTNLILQDFLLGMIRDFIYKQELETSIGLLKQLDMNT